MNLQQAKITLEKINRLYQSMTIKTPRVIRKTVEKSPVVQEISVPQFTPEPKPVPEPEPIQMAEPVPVRVEQPAEKYIPPPAAPTPSYKADELPNSVPLESDEYEELFELPATKELSDRLSSTPIRDLTKAISINEKILTCNELFKKDKTRFNDALKTLNGFSSFSEARPYLASLANEFGWDKKNRKKKAQIFIKLVRRRYN